jgi:hypothetical protein
MASIANCEFTERYVHHELIELMLFIVKAGGSSLARCFHIAARCPSDVNMWLLTEHGS